MSNNIHKNPYQDAVVSVNAHHNPSSATTVREARVLPNCAELSLYHLNFCFSDYKLSQIPVRWYQCQGLNEFTIRAA